MRDGSAGEASAALNGIGTMTAKALGMALRTLPLVRAAVLLTEMDRARERSNVRAVMQAFGLEPDQRGVLAARAYLYAQNILPLRMGDVPYGGDGNKAVATAVMLAELAYPGMTGLYSQGNAAAEVTMRRAVDEALSDPAAMIERAKSGQPIEVTDDLLKALDRQGQPTRAPDGACAVDPVDLDAITRRTGEKGGEPTGEPEREPKASQEEQNTLKAEIEAGDILAADGFVVERQPPLSALDLAEGIDINKKPDLRVGGKIYDAYAPFSDKVDQVRNGI